MNPHVVCCLVGPLVCHNNPKRRQITLGCSYRSTCSIEILKEKIFDTRPTFYEDFIRGGETTGPPGGLNGSNLPGSTLGSLQNTRYVQFLNIYMYIRI